MQYKKLSKIYDKFTADKNDTEWIDYIESLFRKNKIKPNSSILDACCGTGGKTYELSKRGYNVIGLDKSSDMLETAASKLAEKGVRIQLICQDICSIMLHSKQDVVVCINDGINYLTDLINVKKAFESIFDVLAEGGLFLFDMSSEYKLKSMHDNSFFEETDDSAYIWHNQYDKKSKLLTMDISLFSQIEDDIYEKANEVHTQRAYSVKEIENLLKETGFKDIMYFECFTDKIPSEISQRIQFSARKS